jgi:predicted secreted hydrolase
LADHGCRQLAAASPDRLDERQRTGDSDVTEPSPIVMLDYDLANPKPRGPEQEWQPHEKQSDKSWEWWYLTTLLFDVAGNPYFLMWCVFHVKGEAHLPPGMTALPGHRLVTSWTMLSDYRARWHFTSKPYAVTTDESTWEPAGNALLFKASDNSHEFVSRWAFKNGTMHLSVESALVSCDLEIGGADRVMWAKDKLGVEGFIQEGAEGDLSFYYSLPKLTLRGSLSTDRSGGGQQQVDVTGQGWVDRQWGDWMTKSWEWSSLRFANGARVNLYNFPNGHQVGTYQRPDGATRWFDTYVVKQNGYLKTRERGIWVSWGWSYELPLDVEGSRHYTLRPLSDKDMLESGANTFYEGPSILVDDATGQEVGIAVTESMDVRVMGNAPYGERQH